MSNERKDYKENSKQYILSQLYGYGLPDGWCKSIIPNFVDELVDALGSLVEHFHITDCKEKFGSLRIYWCWNDDLFCENDERILVSDKVDAVINKYEYISTKTCVKCGRLATTHGNEYLAYCDICIRFTN